MKNTLSLLTAVLLSPAVKCQQHDKGVYVTVTGFFAAEPFFSSQQHGGLSVSFPYQVTNAFGATSDSVFHSRVIHPFDALKLFIVHFGLDAGDPHQFAGFHFSPTLMGEGATGNGIMFTLNYGRNLFFDWPGTAHSHRKRFVLKPSLGIVSAVYTGADNGSPTYLGSINNKGQTISFAGHTAGPIYTYSTRFATYTDSVALLDIYYGQREWSLQPKIAIGTNPYSRWYMEVYAAYTFAVSEQGKVYFTQDNINQIVIDDLKNNALTVQYNGTPVKTTPYHLNGWNVGFVLGVNFCRNCNWGR